MITCLRGQAIAVLLLLFPILSIFRQHGDLTMYYAIQERILNAIDREVPTGKVILPLPVLQRSPYFIILGTQKGGTTALRKRLLQHPQILYHDQEELYFFSQHFQPYVDEKASQQDEHYGIEKARQAHAQLYPYQQLQSNSSLVAFDSSPDYLFQSDRIAKRISQINPWSKLLVLLRNPVTRAYSDYDMEYHRGRINASFELYVQQDLQRMQRAGLTHGWNGTSWNKTAFDAFSGTPQQDEAWNVYWNTLNRGMHPVGRGLYAIQLRHWFHQYNITDSEKQSQFLVLRHEVMKRKNESIPTLDQVVKFLGLHPQYLKEQDVKQTHHVGKYKQGKRMKATTQWMLKDFFQPYNQQLGAILGRQWVGVWDS